MKLSTDCQPIVMHTLRIVIIGRFGFAFLTSNPPIFRVPPFNSDHGADAPHDRPMIAPWSPVHLQVATVKNAKKNCTSEIFSIFRKSRKMCKKWWKMTIFSNFFLNKNMFSKVVF